MQITNVIEIGSFWGNHLTNVTTWDDQNAKKSALCLKRNVFNLYPADFHL